MTSHAHLVWPRRNVARQSGGRRRIAPARRVSERAAARPMARGGLDVFAGDTGYAYGTVHTLLREAGAVLRTPGRPTEQP